MMKDMKKNGKRNFVKHFVCVIKTITSLMQKNEYNELSVNEKQMSQPWGYERGHPWGCKKEEEEMDEAIVVIDCVKGRETGYGHGGRGWRHGRGACSGGRR